MNQSTIYRGVVHGNTIEFGQDLGLPEGQLVEVTVQPMSGSTANGEGLKRAFGGWSEDANQLDDYLDWNRNQRKQGRRDNLS